MRASHTAGLSCTSRHERLVRKHVPDSDPGWIPAPAGDTNHRRPNNHSPGSQEKCSAGACPQLGAGCVAQTTPVPSINQCTRFSYLGVPAPAGMSDWYESMSRTPIRDEFRHRPATPTTIARTTTAQGRKRNVALGLVPLPAGSGGRPATVTTAPTSSFRRRPESRGGMGGRRHFSYLGVPAAAGMGDSYGTLPSLDQRAVDSNFHL